MLPTRKVKRENLFSTVFSTLFSTVRLKWAIVTSQEPNETLASPVDPTWGQAIWRRLCQISTKIFYGRFEVTGLEHLPTKGPVILCANHVNALADGLVVQASSPRPAHPIARSGLFRNPLLRPILALLQAVPIHRRHPGRDTRAANEASFRRIYELLEAGRVLLIFPEGQSHSNPHLKPLKTGAARIALGVAERTGTPPVIVPVGLTFPQKGRFRSEALVQYGPPVEIPAAIPGETHQAAVDRLTKAILRGLEGVTLNVESWQDLRLMRLLQTFFLFRRGRHAPDEENRDDEKAAAGAIPTPRGRLAARFRSLQRLIETHRRLRLIRPDHVRLLAAKLERFERLCRRYGVESYHLELHYDAWIISRFLLRALIFACLVFPLALWGFVMSGLPYAATRLTAHRTARGRDQYDTAGMLFGTFFFLAFWGAQTFGVFWLWGLDAAAIYAASLPLTAAVALELGKERRRIAENVRIFFLFTRKKELKSYLRLKREELEIDLAQTARLAKRLDEEARAA